jgi:hypothetical protein
VLSEGDIFGPYFGIHREGIYHEVMVFPARIVIRCLAQLWTSKSGPLLPWIPYIRSSSGDNAESSVKFRAKAVKV